MFSIKHIVILTCTLVLIVGLLFFTRKWDLKKKSFGFLCVGLLSEVVKVFFYIVKNEEEYGGVLPKTDLPFQLCSIQIIFILVVVLTKNENIRRVLLAFMFPSGLIGGAAAVLIPTPSSLNYLVITFQYYIYHAALIAFALSIVRDKEINLRIEDYRNCLLFILALMFFAVYINSMMYDNVGGKNVNFMYVVSPPVEGLPFLNEEHGWLVYILHYACIVLLSITACYAKPIVEAIKARFTKTE